MDGIPMRATRLLTLATVALTAVAPATQAAASRSAAAGRASHFTLTRAFDYSSGTNKVVRWAPCMRYGGKRHHNVIEYSVNPAGHHSRIRLAKRAVRKLHRATGLSFDYAGRTSYIPHKISDVLQGAEQLRTTGSQLVIAWAYLGTGKHASNLLTGTEQGVGTIRWASSPTSGLRINAGAVVMKRGVHLRHGFQAGGSVGTLLLHELGHAVGLQHTDDPTQIMHAFLGADSPAGYAVGDRGGLSRVGADAGCVKGRSLPPTNG